MLVSSRSLSHRQYRDTFINAYRANPTQVLSLTKAKSLVEGDAATITK